MPDQSSSLKTTLPVFDRKKRFKTLKANNIIKKTLRFLCLKPRDLQ